MNEEMNIGEGGVSPYSPPEAYNPPKVDEEVPYENMHPFLQSLRDEHDAFTKELSKFEETLDMMQNGKVDREIDKRLQAFFEYFDEEIREHNLKEEKVFFPLVSDMMDKDGNHSKGKDDFNAIDILEDEHIKFIQMTAIVFNFFALFSRIPDEKSRIIILDAAIAESRALVELLKVHIFREDNIVFIYAHNNLSKEDFEKIELQSKEKKHVN